MTRRAQRKRRVLSVNAYIHRATLGLPKDERLDTAAELRSHLLERIAEYESQGFSREEAEYLAVKGMGEPEPVNRGMLGHAFTNKAGWLVLAALVLSMAGWYGYRATQWVGVRPTDSISQDDTALMHIPNDTWPSFSGAFKNTAEIRFPVGTQQVVAAFLTHDSKNLRPSFMFPVAHLLLPKSQGKTGRVEPYSAEDARKFWQGRFRLVSVVGPSFASHTGQKSCPDGQSQVANLLYGTGLYYPPQAGVVQESRHGVDSVFDLLSGFCIENSANFGLPLATELYLNTWTEVMRIPVGPSGDDATLALLLYPTDSQGFDPEKAKPEDTYRYNPTTRSWERR